MTGLTPRQADCLRSISKLTTSDGVSPTYEQIMADLGLASKAGVHRLITALVERGHVDRMPYRNRTLSVRAPADGRVDAIMADIMATDTAAFLGERNQQVIRDCIARGLAQ